MVFIKKIHWFIPLILLIIGAFSVQYSIPTIIGADGFLHGRMSLLTAEQGFLKTFPQAYFSWFRDRFSDKDFLYHLYLIPFVLSFGLIWGAKLGAFIATSTLFATVFILLKKYSQGVGVWMALALLFSSQFLRDTAEPRPFIFAITLTLMGIYAVANKDTRLLFFVSLFFGMTHLSAWVLVFFTIGIYGIDWIMTTKGSKLLIGASLAGYGLSFFFHPNFPNNIFYTYLNGVLVPWYAAQTGVLELGAEFFPLFTHEILRYFPLLIGGFILMGICMAIHPVRWRRETIIWGFATLLFSVFALMAKKNLTHLYPIYVVFIGIFLKDWFTSFKNESREKKIRVLSVGVIFVCILLLFGGWQTIMYVRLSLKSERFYGNHFMQMATSLTQHVPLGSRVFHTNWSDAQYLIGLAPDYEYIVTLDPIYMYDFNPKLYQIYRMTSFAESNDPYLILSQVFGAKFGYAGKNYFNKFISQIKNDHRFTILDEDDLGILFMLQNKQ